MVRFTSKALLLMLSKRQEVYNFKMDYTKDIFKIRKPRPRHPVINEIKNRFSPRHFSSTPIPDEHIDSIFEAARFAPSGWNFEPWYF